MKNKNNNYFWFETNKFDKKNYRSYYFYNPVKILSLTDPKNLKQFFKELEKLSKQYYCAGFFSYEMGYLFEDIFNYNIKKPFPYAKFYAYEKLDIINHNKDKNKFTHPLSDYDKSDYKLKNLKLNISEKEYIKNIHKLKNYIYKGDIYQANYTLKYKFHFTGTAEKLYHDLKTQQNAAYNVFAKMDDFYILSLSPELFFYKNKQHIMVKPMKGTMKRGHTIEEDNQHEKWLQNDEKNKSENIMIVDLLRNDLGKISEYGSVKVTKLLESEKYNTLFQMTSTIKSKLRKNTSLYELIKSIFPSGSVTGSPKIRSMEIIRELEKEKRKIYTGALGFFQPDGTAKFNVPIRTILINKNKGEMGIGSGIVFDSKACEEFLECKLKASFLIKKPVPSFTFQLIETFLFDKHYKYPGLHLKRLKESARYFNFKYNRKKIITKLEKMKKQLKNDKYKIRLLLDKSGKITTEHIKLEHQNKDYKITISSYRTNSNDIFYFHKTTNRSLYENEFKNARAKGYFDIVFLNEKKQITEGAISNIYIKKNDRFFTPPVQCGLLNGVIRHVKIKTLNNIEEKIITLKDIYNADSIYISNSIIGFQKASLYKGSQKNGDGSDSFY